MAMPNTTQARDALAWVTNDQKKAKEPDTNPFVWLMEAVEGDFNENRSTKQILTDAAISMIPLVDQICDIRDLIADCRKLTRDIEDSEAWIALILTLIGLFPSLGSLVKGVLKIFFSFVRRLGPDATVKAIRLGMSWVITFLRRREVQKYLRSHQVDDVFKWLATQIRPMRKKINTRTLLDAFDYVVRIFSNLVSRVEMIPVVGKRAKATLMQVKEIRLAADARIGKFLQPVQDVVDTIIKHLEREALESRHGIVNANNIHFRGTMPEAAAVMLMRKRQPQWLSKMGDKFIQPASVKRYRSDVDRLSAKFDKMGKERPLAERFPYLSDRSIESFHELEAVSIKGPARLYRILAPNSRGMSDCWVSEEVFQRLQNAPNPKEAWRRFLAVWPDWNVNGQFVIYDVKAGETLNVWRGIASSQEKKALTGNFLEGGWEQIVFNIERSDARVDTMLYYKIKHGTQTTLGKAMTQAEVDRATAGMNASQKAIFFEEHLALRERINHPNISGPFETGWGYDDFDGAGLTDKIGLPALSGQVTQLAK